VQVERWSERDGLRMSRRSFMALVAAVAAATGLPEQVVAEDLAQADEGAVARAAALTTLAQTLAPGPANDLGYRAVATAGGEPHVVREEAATAQPDRAGRRTSLLCFVHLTDQHIIDCQSPARVEFLDRFVNSACPPPFSSAWRPQEAASARLAEAMLQRIRAIGRSPVTGAPIAAAVCTGDNTDNQQENEVAVFLSVMDGGTVTPQSGDPARYEGVQTSGDPAYWHPDPAVEDRYKTALGFPALPGFLEAALAPFEAPGIGVPWFTCFGNHDGLVQGNAPANPVFEGVATSELKVTGPGPANPCLLADGEVPIAPPGAPAQRTTADPTRRFLTRAEYAQAHLDAPGLPRGHGLTQADVDAGRLHYVADVGPVRFIVLDTVNPGGFSEGSIGDAQLAFLEQALQSADDDRRPAVLFSHHGPRSLTNPVVAPDPADPSGGDLPRRMADDVLAVCRAHPSCVLWVNGHTHANVITLQGDGGPGTFWDVGTAAHIDWPPQARIVELVDNADGTLSIFTTMVDLDDADPVVVRARELMANDPQAGFDLGGTGEAGDRNAELLIANPFNETGPLPTPTPSPTRQAGLGTGGGRAAAAQLPATGGGLPSLTVGGALLAVGGMGLRRLGRRP
jgi:metallophosphoesterase (TIGR03767 family)